MGESQSRYSIVERLTNKKLSIIDSKADLGNEIERKRQRFKQDSLELKEWEKQANEETQRNKKQREIGLQLLESDVDFLRKQQTEKEKIYDLKIIEIEKALTALTEISKSAGSSE